MLAAREVVGHPSSDLPVWYCGNPRCVARMKGRPRVVLIGYYPPLTVAQSLPCPACGHRTIVTIGPDGRAEYSVRHR